MGPAITLINQKMVMDTVGCTCDEEDGDNRNEKVENDSKGEQKTLHSGEGPGHGGSLVRGASLFYRLEGPLMGSPMMFPMASSLKSSQMGYLSGSREQVAEVLGQQWRV